MTVAIYKHANLVCCSYDNVSALDIIVVVVAICQSASPVCHGCGNV